MRTIDLNADVGEGFPDDDRLIPLATSVNIACGAHAGDRETMVRTMRLAKDAGACIGAHPGYDDRGNFGRRPLAIPADELEESMVRQLAAFLDAAAACSILAHHVKPHGALYSAAEREPLVARTLVRAVARMLPGTMIYAPPNGILAATARLSGLQPVAEGFADRIYQPDGSLAPRNSPGACIESVERTVEQALGLAVLGQVRTTDGSSLRLACRSICIHGDDAMAYERLLRVRQALVSEGVAVLAP